MPQSESTSPAASPLESTEERIHGGFLHLASRELSQRLAVPNPTLHDCLLGAIYFRKAGDQAQALRLLELHQASPLFETTYNRILSICHNLNFTSAQQSAEQALDHWADSWTAEQQQYAKDIHQITSSLSRHGRFPTELRLDLLERNRYHNLDSREHTPCTGIIDRNNRYGRLVEAVFDPASATWLESKTGHAIGELLQPNHDFRSFFGGARPWLAQGSSRADQDGDQIQNVCIFIESNPHFGHFLTQSASFASALSHAQHFTGDADISITILSKGTLPEWAKALLAASCPNPLQFKLMDGQRRLHVQQLAVAPPTWIEWHYAHQNHQRLFRQAAWRWLASTAPSTTPSALPSAAKTPDGSGPSMEARGHRRLYFSRSRLQKCLRRSVNEDQLEETLGRYGFEIIHPQELPLQDVARLVNEAALIGGAMGSAMHNVLFRLPGPALATLNFAHHLPGINNAMIEHCSFIDHNFYSRSCEELEGQPGEPACLHFDLKRCIESVEQVLDRLESLG